jgi:hypothetical protein
MARHRISTGFVAAALLALPFQGLRADSAPKVVEEVNFAISCGPASQKAFKHAVWTLHSFWYPEALEQFTAIATSEPGCAMAYWGNQPAAALVEYRAMLSTDPNRLRSLLGEARAAKQIGDSATAHDAYDKLVAFSKLVGPERSELAETRSLSNKLTSAVRSYG